jgi:hypothetical protein
MTIPYRLAIIFSIFYCASENVSAQSTAAKPKPLVKDIYTADPSAHVFNGKIYIYPSHDVESNVPQDDEGGHFAMRDYHIFSMDNINGPAKDNGVALDVKDIPWAGRQLWAPDAAFKNGTYYLYFPVKDKKDVFKIGRGNQQIAYRAFQAGSPIRFPAVTALTRQFLRTKTENLICISGESGAGNCSAGTQESTTQA